MDDLEKRKWAWLDRLNAVLKEGEAIGAKVPAFEISFPEPDLREVMPPLPVPKRKRKAVR